MEFLLHNVCNIELMKWNCLNSGCQTKHLAKYLQMSSSVGILKGEEKFVKSTFTRRTHGNLFWKKFEEGVFTNHLKFTVLMYQTAFRFIGYFGFPHVLCCYLPCVKAWCFHLSYFLCDLIWECYKTYFYLVHEKQHLFPSLHTFWQNIAVLHELNMYIFLTQI